MADLHDSFQHALLAHLEAHADQPAVLEALPLDCCYGAAVRGVQGCTCWEPVYDLEQAEPDPDAVALLAVGVEPMTRRLMCGDCAYRPGSPEKAGDERYQGDSEHLEQLARESRFWCHQGMRQPIAWRHRHLYDMEIPDRHDGNYQPPIIAGVPYRADGTPGELCGGWDARRRALTAEQRVSGGTSSFVTGNEASC